VDIRNGGKRRRRTRQGGNIWREEAKKEGRKISVKRMRKIETNKNF
jgi:hypothetical protein